MECPVGEVDVGGVIGVRDDHEGLDLRECRRAVCRGFWGFVCRGWRLWIWGGGCCCVLWKGGDGGVVVVGDVVDFFGWMGKCGAPCSEIDVEASVGEGLSLEEVVVSEDREWNAKLFGDV